MVVAASPATYAFAATDIRTAEVAFSAADAALWTEARAAARGTNDPVVSKLVTWHDLVRRDTSASFSEISGFIAANPNWPWPKTMQRRAETAMNGGVAPDAVIAFFQARAPLTTNGRVRLARALQAVGDTPSARAAAREAWIEGSFGRSEEAAFLADFSGSISPADHTRRLDQLLWSGKTSQAQRMLPRVAPGDRALSVARLQLRGMKPGVDGAIGKVPGHLITDPGLVYERVRWRRKKDMDDGARSLLVTYPSVAGDPRLWWTERSILVRRALADGYISEAYRVASGHGMADGSDFAKAEWLAGWIALRFLNDPRLAQRHFETMYGAVSYPISLARGAYWTARAAEAAGQRDSATQWYRAAAAHPTTFYGQLAAQEIAPGQRMPLPTDAAPTSAEESAFEAHDLTRAVRILAAIGQQKRLAPFLLRLAAIDDSPGWKALAARLAHDTGRPDMGVFIGKQAYRTGNHLIELGYPEVPLPPPPGLDLEDQLVLGLIRQESAFRRDAVSPAGARGLMQLMPATAKRVAGQIGVPYNKSLLTVDTSYNLTLGQAYLGQMLDRFDGSYILALAAYNAGPGRSVRWREARGDPGASVEQAVDWIESIPFKETRNYVQRTLENVQVYRGKDASASNATLDRDLLR